MQPVRVNMSEGIFQHKTATLTMQPIRVNMKRGDIPTQDCNTYYAAHKDQHEARRCSNKTATLTMQPVLINIEWGDIPTGLYKHLLYTTYGLQGSTLSKGIFQHKTGALTIWSIRVNIERGDIPTQDCSISATTKAHFACWVDCDWQYRTTEREKRRAVGSHSAILIYLKTSRDEVTYDSTAKLKGFLTYLTSSSRSSRSETYNILFWPPFC